jgi:hypothetical protein
MPGNERPRFIPYSQGDLGAGQVTRQEVDMSTHVIIPVTYKKEWRDGFGARGWKLDCSVNDPMVIASTSQTGNRIPTSVLVHDMLDHYLCGFPLSGHRNEAKALIQLQERTGSDPAPDFAQMVDEDLMTGIVNGESLRSFITEQNRLDIPDQLSGNIEILEHLFNTLGKNATRELLITQFFIHGRNGIKQAQEAWKLNGLAYSKRAEYGLALQQILEVADCYIQSHNVEELRGEFILTSTDCSLHFDTPYELDIKSKLAA